MPQPDRLPQNRGLLPLRSAGGPRSLPAVGAILGLALLTAAAIDAQPRPVRVEELVEGGGRLDWSTRGERLAYDAEDTARGDGLWDIWIRERSGGRGRCLTCTAPDLRRVHAINPDWHPSGDWIVFQTVGLARRTGVDARELDSPLRGNRGEIWIGRSDGRDFWRLTDYRGLGGGVLDPAFSWEGRRLLWAERIRSRHDDFGAWRLRSAALEFRRGVPALDDMEVVFEPDEPALVIPHGFTLDDRGQVFSANLESGIRETAVDVYLRDGDGELHRLTRTGGVAEDVARLHPDGTSITYASDATLRRGETSGGRPVRELWTMELDGSEARRLTFFNEPPADEYRGPTWVGDFDWTPGGDAVAVQVVSGRGGEAAIVLLTWLPPGNGAEELSPGS